MQYAGCPTSSSSSDDDGDDFNFDAVQNGESIIGEDMNDISDGLGENMKLDLSKNTIINMWMILALFIAVNVVCIGCTEIKKKKEEKSYLASEISIT